MGTSPNEKDRPKPETVEAIYDYMKTVPEAQRNHWNDLDRKMVQIY